MTEQAYTGKKFALQATTPLGDDMLIATALEGAEHLSLPFLFTLSFWTGHDDLDPSQLVGEGVTAKLIDDEGNERLIHGLVTRLTIAGTHWLAEIRPWLWMLSLAIDSKIFQQKTAVEIIKAVCQDAGYSDLKDSLTGTYAARDYCVQYQETSLDFLHRLMEEEGIWYFFEHAEGKHTLVLADDASALTDCPQAASLPYQPLSESRAWLSNKRIESATLELSVAPGKVQADDFNFETPATDLKVAAAGKTGSLQVYDYPGLYAKKDAGEAAIKRRLQELQAAIKLLHGGGPMRHFAPGTKFTLTGHPAASLNAAWAFRTVHHSAAQDEYSNRFVAHPADLLFRPPRVTPKPRIPGTQTAIVTGKSGEEIWTDKYGRVKVQFHWDQDGAGDEKTSCWVRVAQSWAGKGWGAWFLPRIGQEVVVSFLDGDPDRPLVTGAVYNGDNTLPYTLPDDMTKSTIKSNSSKNGKVFNEIRFEDKTDSEEFHMRAGKDMKVEVKNDRSTTIEEGNDTLTVSKGDRAITITKGKHDLTVSEGDRSVAVSKGNETHGVKGTRAVTVEDAETHTSKADYTHKVSGNFTLKVEGDLTIQAGGSLTIKAGGSLTVQSDADVTAKSGSDMTVQSGTGMVLKGGTTLDAKSGTDLSVKAGTGLSLQGTTTLEAKGSASGTIDGGGMLTVKGGMVKIN